MTHYVVMFMVNIAEAKAHLSEYLNRLEEEREVIVCRRNVPVAVIRPVEDNGGRRQIGLEKGRLDVPDSFFEPLPEGLLELYSGGGS